MAGLSHLEIKNLKPKDKPYRVFDKGGVPGLCLQISTGGKKTFYLTYRMDGKARFFKLGSWPDTKLKEARDEAGKWRKFVEKNIDPKREKARQEKEKKIRDAIEREQGTVKQLFKFYRSGLENQGKRSAEQVKRIYNADIDSIIGGTAANEVIPDDIRAVLAPIKKRKAFVLANRVRSYLSAAFNYGIRWKDKDEYTNDIRFDITMNPVSSVDKPLKEEAAGERTLSEKEIKRLWAAAGDKDKFPQPTGLMLRLMLATGGQRVEEVLQAPWSEFDMDSGLWELPPERTKKDRAHVVPLTGLTKAVLKELNEQTGEDAYLFPMYGKEKEGPMRTDSLGNAIRQFRKGKHWKEKGCDNFTARDLRRTVKTLMGKAGISKETRDRLQNHKLSDTSSKHYDRYDYLAEKRVAMTVWEANLTSIIEGKKPKVEKLEQLKEKKES